MAGFRTSPPAYVVCLHVAPFHLIHLLRLLQVTVNARTGEVQGERPYSTLKIALAVVAALIVILLIVWLSQRPA